MRLKYVGIHLAGLYTYLFVASHAAVIHIHTQTHKRKKNIQFLTPCSPRMRLIRLRETDVSTVESDNLHFGYRTHARYVYICIHITYDIKHVDLIIYIYNIKCIHV